tara:strand:+ start:542 stop:718 length:177 start_codon:yes stop_codon:yes gene_type:complete
MEELIIKKLDGGMRGLRNGTKTIEQAKIMYFLEKLLEVNEGLYYDYSEAYTKIKKDRE